MLHAILAKLNGDSTLTALLRATSVDSRIYPLTVNGFGPAIAYTDTPVERGFPNLDTIEFRVTSPSFEVTKAISERVTELLNMTEGDAGWYDDGVHILFVGLNGAGGNLDFSTPKQDVYQRFVNINVKWRRS